MILYLDASALLKRYLAERGSDVLRRTTDLAERWVMSRIGFVETLAALARNASPERVAQFHAEWKSVTVVEFRAPLAERAGDLAASDGLGALDAIHLASALSLAGEDLMFATWDRRLHDAARGRGLAVLPEALA